MTVALVTDSTACLPAALVERHGITVVPLHLVVDGEPGVEGRDFTTQRVVESLRRHAPVTTSRPAQGAFDAAYAACAAAGASEVVSVHLSGALSSTVEGARLAAASAPLTVRVVDSRSLGLALGHAVVAAAEAAAEGASGALTEAVAGERAEASTVTFSVESLEHLRRGGRIGAAAALVGQVLAIKPILGLQDGAIVPLERVRTTARAVQRLEDRAVQLAGDQVVDVGVHQIDAEDRAARLAERLEARLPHLRSIEIVELTAVVGAHAGPGTLGVSVSPHPQG